MEIVEIENIKTIENINETKSWFLDRIKLTNLQQNSLSQSERGTKYIKSQIKISDNGNLKIQKIIRKYYK